MSTKDDYPAIAVLYDAWLGSGRHQPEAVRAFIEINELRILIADLTDDGECSFDHHGYCQEHGWFDKSECPHARAQRLFQSYTQPTTPTPGATNHV